MSLEMVKLSDICDLKNGYAFKSNDYIENSDTLICRMSNIRPGGKFDLGYNPKYIDNKLSNKYKEYLLNDGDLVIAMTDLANNPKILGVPTIVETKGKQVLLNQRVGKLIVKSGEVNIPYLRRILSHPSIRGYYSKFAGGGLQINIGKKEILGVKIPLPPLETQKKIAGALDKAQELIDKRKEQIAKMDEFLQSVFLDMFGDPVTNPKGWIEEKLGNISNLSSGVTKGKKYKVDTFEVPYMRVANVQDGHILLNEIKTIFVSKNDIDKYALQYGDVLLTEGGDPDKLGRGAVWKYNIGTCIHQNHIFKLRLNTNMYNPEYISRIISSQKGKRYFLKSAKQTTGIATINMTQLKKCPILLPPIDLQNKFASIVEKTELEKEKLQKSLEEMEKNFNSIMQRAFKGELF